jgi:hypothetical protein
MIFDYKTYFKAGTYWMAGLVLFLFSIEAGSAGKLLSTPSFSHPIPCLLYSLLHVN